MNITTFMFNRLPQNFSNSRIFCTKSKFVSSSIHTAAANVYPQNHASCFYRRSSWSYLAVVQYKFRHRFSNYCQHRSKRTAVSNTFLYGSFTRSPNISLQIFYWRITVKKLILPLSQKHYKAFYIPSIKKCFVRPAKCAEATISSS